MLLWLDDIRRPPADKESYYWAKTAWQALHVLVTGQDRDFTAWSLDHDLGENQATGYDFLKLVDMLLRRCENGLYVPETVQIHSANPVGRENMKSILRQWGNCR